MKKYTELLKSAREQLGKYGRALLVMTGEAPVENNRICNEIDAAISATKEEYDEQWERIQKEFEPLRTALENAEKARDAYKKESVSDYAKLLASDKYAAKLEKAGMFLRCALEGALSAMQLPLSECEEIAAWDAARRDKP